MLPKKFRMAPPEPCGSPEKHRAAPGIEKLPPARQFYYIFAHRLLMKLMYAAEKKTPPEKRSAQAAAIVETYGTCTDFYDETAAKRLVAELLPQS